MGTNSTRLPPPPTASEIAEAQANLLARRGQLSVIDPAAKEVNVTAAELRSEVTAIRGRRARREMAVSLSVLGILLLFHILGRNLISALLNSASDTQEMVAYTLILFACALDIVVGTWAATKVIRAIDLD